MELLYLWISNYRNIIINQGFNLSSRFIIKFDPLKKRIDIVDNENYIENLFHNDIIDIKGIVGENGSGKSTLLKYFVHEYFTPKLEDPDKSADMIIFLSPNDSLNVCFVDNLGIKEENIVFDRNKFKVRLQSSNTGLYWEMIGDPYEYDDRKCASFRKTSFVYFSDVVDLNETSESFNGLCNVCTNYLIGNDRLNLTNDPQLPYSELTAHKLKELDRQIDYVLSKKVQDFKLFKLPNLIGIGQSNTDYKSLENLFNKLSELKRKASKSEKLQRIFLSRILTLIKNNQKYYLTRDYKIIMKIKFRICFLYNHIRSLKNFFSIIESDDTIIQIGKCYINSITKKEIDIDFLLSNFIVIEKEISSNYSFNLLTDKIRKYLDFENILFDELINYYPDSKLQWLDYVSVNVDQPKLNELREKYKQSLTITDYLTWSWRDMSSGERGYLTIFSRLYSLNKRANDDFQKSSNLMIFLDEVELFFHPQWQKKLISFLISELPIIFSGKKLQIFITSHSPFILSDLPPNNAILLRKGKELDKDINGKSLEHNCVVEEMFDRRTFGANIHSLYTEEFFISDGPIGEFSKMKINNLIKYLKIKPRKKYGFDKSTSKKLINCIGEPIVSNQLNDLWNEKFHVLKDDSDKSELLRQIQILKLENKKLRNETNRN